MSVDLTRAVIDPGWLNHWRGIWQKKLARKRLHDDEAVLLNAINVSDVLPSRAKDLPWSWADEDRNTRTRQCLCCGRPGHHQEMLEAHIAEHGFEGLGIVVENGFVEDGHHRVVAAIRLGVDRLPLETKEDAQARWVRDHGYVDWAHRKSGDR